MQLILVYDGVIPSARQRKSFEIAHIRRCLSAQVRDFVNRAWQKGLDPAFHSRLVGSRNYEFVVGSALRNVADVDVLLLTPPGRPSPGDIDNRLKALTDALACPSGEQADAAGVGEDEMICVLEDDRLIHRRAVTQRTWFGQPPNSRASLAVITVTILNDPEARSTLGGAVLAQ